MIKQFFQISIFTFLIFIRSISQPQGMELLKDSLRLGKSFAQSLVCETPNLEDPEHPFPPCFPIYDMVHGLAHLKVKEVVSQVVNHIYQHPIDSFCFISTIALVHDMACSPEQLEIANKSIQTLKCLKNIGKFFILGQKPIKCATVMHPQRGECLGYVRLPVPKDEQTRPMGMEDLLQGAYDVFLLCHNIFYFSDLVFGDKAPLPPAPTFEKCTIGFMPDATVYCDQVLAGVVPANQFSDTRDKLIASHPLVQCGIAYQYGSPYIPQDIEKAKIFLNKAMEYNHPLAKQLLSGATELKIPRYYFVKNYVKPEKGISIKSDEVCKVVDNGEKICRSDRLEIMSSIYWNEVDAFNQANATYINYAQHLGVSTFHSQGFRGYGQTLLILEDSIHLASLPRSQNIDYYNAHELSDLRTLNQEKEGPFSRYEPIGYHFNNVSYFHGTMDTSILQNIAPDARIVFLRVEQLPTDFDAARYLPKDTQIDAVSLSLKPTDGNYFHLFNFLQHFTKQNIPVFLSAGNNNESMDEKTSFMQIALFDRKVVPVVATTPNNDMASFSNYPDVTIDIALSAPGENICALQPYTTAAGDGTSYATPLAAASYVLLKQRYPQASSDLLLKALRHGAQKAIDQKELGAGIINLEKSAKFLHRKLNWL